MKKLLLTLALCLSANVNAAIINLSLSDSVISVGESTTVTVSLVTEQSDAFDFINLDFIFDTSLAAFNVGSESFFGVISAAEGDAFVTEFSDGIYLSYYDTAFDLITDSTDLFSFELTGLAVGTVHISMDDWLGSGYFDVNLDDSVYVDFSELNGISFDIVAAEVSAPATGALFLAGALLLAGMRRKQNA